MATSTLSQETGKLAGVDAEEGPGGNAEQLTLPPAPEKSAFKRVLSSKAGIAVSFEEFTKVHYVNFKEKYDIEAIANEAPELEKTPLAKDENLRTSLTLYW